MGCDRFFFSFGYGEFQLVIVLFSFFLLWWAYLISSGGFEIIFGVNLVGFWWIWLVVMVTSVYGWIWWPVVKNIFIGFMDFRGK